MDRDGGASAVPALYIDVARAVFNYEMQDVYATEMEDVEPFTPEATVAEFVAPRARQIAALRDAGATPIEVGKWAVLACVREPEFTAPPYGNWAEWVRIILSEVRSEDYAWAVTPTEPPYPHVGLIDG